MECICTVYALYMRYIKIEYAMQMQCISAIYNLIYNLFFLMLLQNLVHEEFLSG
jgi:hypothetical protein